MSVTFSAESVTTADTRTFELRCEGGGTIGGLWTGYRNALTEAHAHGLVCPSCVLYGAYIDEVPSPGNPATVNVSNANAAALLTALGMRLPGEEYPDLCGTEDARVFLDRVEVALSGAVGLDDSGTTPVTYQAGDLEHPGALVIECGRSPGYLTRRLGELRELAHACLTEGLRVTWG